MPAFHGRAVLIEIGAESLADELRTKNVAFNGELVDVTTDGDEGWTTTMDGIFNINNVTIALEGVLKDDTLSEMAFNGDHEDMVITVGPLFTLTGTFQFQPGFTIGAPYNTESTFSGTLQSVGSVAKAAVGV